MISGAAAAAVRQGFKNQREKKKNKNKKTHFIHIRNRDFIGIFHYQNNPIMATYIFAVRELYNIYKYIYI